MKYKLIKDNAVKVTKSSSLVEILKKNGWKVDGGGAKAEAKVKSEA